MTVLNRSLIDVKQYLHDRDIIADALDRADKNGENGLLLSYMAGCLVFARVSPIVPPGEVMTEILEPPTDAVPICCINSTGCVC